MNLHAWVQPSKITNSEQERKPGRLEWVESSVRGDLWQEDGFEICRDVRFGDGSTNKKRGDKAEGGRVEDVRVLKIILKLI